MNARPAQFWDDLAERYAKKAVPNPAAYQRKLEVTKSYLTPESQILDFGCGTGSLALELAPHVGHVHAVDLSGEMIRIARAKASDQNVSNVTFHHGMVEDALPFESAQFDGVCAYNLLHLVDDRRAVLEKIFDLLKPGGFFISSTACLGESYVPFALILPVMRWLKKAPRVQVFRLRSWTDELLRAGFTDLRAPDVGADKRTAFFVVTKP